VRQSLDGLELNTETGITDAGYNTGSSAVQLLAQQPEIRFLPGVRAK